MTKAKRPSSKRLSRKQFRFIDALCANKSKEHSILARHKVSRQLYRKWLSDAKFCEELNQAVAGGYRRSTFMLARNALLAAERLIDLTQSKSEEVRRKACMDIITMKPPTFQPTTFAASGDKDEQPSPISPQKASRVLAVLAEENNDSK
jgi:hypothetical protein